MRSHILIPVNALTTGDFSSCILSTALAAYMLEPSASLEKEIQQALGSNKLSPSGKLDSPAGEDCALPSSCSVLSEASAVSSSLSASSETTDSTAPGETAKGVECSIPNEAEEELKAIMVDYMTRKDINPFQGSLPVEKIQNILRNHHMDLYTAVVGTKHRAWNKFVERHADTFELLAPEEGKWRMRLLVHEDYLAGDEKERAARDAQDAHLLKTLTEYLLSTPDMTSTVDEFMAAYPELPCNTPESDDQPENPLPKRGDLVRFIKRKTQAFGYDSSNYVVRLLPSYMVEVLLNVA